MMTRHFTAAFGPGLLAGAILLSGCGPSLGQDARQGRVLFAMHCEACHEGEHPELHKQPPKLVGLFQKQTLPSGAPATDAEVRKTIIEGRGTMPAFDQRLSEKEVDDLIKYLHAMQ